LLSKAAPTLNLFSVGMPLRVGLGVLSLFIFLPVLWTSIEAYFYRMIGELEQFMGYFANG
jgi:flagellar biosynthetic protein FliR